MSLQSLERILVQSDKSFDAIERMIASAQQGDAEAMGELLAKYRKYLVFLARSQLHHHMQAKADPSDLAQEVCLAAHDGIQQFQGSTTAEFAAWLRSILTNVLANQVRRYLGTQKRDVRLEQALDQRLADASGFLQSGLAGDVTSPSQQFAKNEAFLELAEALEELPEDYRQVIVLRHVDAMPFTEVSRVMGRSVDSVEKLWVRALGKLRQKLASG
ncbi:sigma-70 family RNA polymerase sigma factor [Aureliella helgolandensis]|uniref:ECF RNA polymerase sigma factor SigW n=1 Tax=Aureliella helgolandensis TaxID=2527968 RepID=A0A518GAC6_9BACT|nr:sigma-70 family RNA polymerase sigma factor [Aureliella helgolandensis]QDV25545.1 ECF RNA polymerase sigma factor SigW [Aureliella helgolandensis]